jgi:hypothetical protein
LICHLLQDAEVLPQWERESDRKCWFGDVTRPCSEHQNILANGCSSPFKKNLNLQTDWIRCAHEAKCPSTRFRTKYSAAGGLSSP